MQPKHHERQQQQGSPLEQLHVRMHAPFLLASSSSSFSSSYFSSSSAFCFLPFSFVLFFAYIIGLCTCHSPSFLSCSFLLPPFFTCVVCAGKVAAAAHWRGAAQRAGTRSGPAGQMAAFPSRRPVQHPHARPQLAPAAQPPFFSLAAQQQYLLAGPAGGGGRAAGPAHARWRAAWVQARAAGLRRGRRQQQARGSGHANQLWPAPAVFFFFFF